jgi:hypothetical protein
MPTSPCIPIGYDPLLSGMLNRPNIDINTSIDETLQLRITPTEE